VDEHFASVLVVDDDDDIREAICGVLEAEGYSTMSAENGEVALRAIDRGRRPCVVLLDLMMPVMNGWDFMRAVAHNRDLDELPVIVVSAYSEQQAPGAKRILKKPLDVKALLAAVREFCCCAPKPPLTRN
jgi:two-component system, chemotaxis family, chemotaxis protein CheY